MVGPLLDVAFQATPSEPSTAAAAAAGRAETRRTHREFWHRIHADGLLPSPVDLEWLTETATVTSHAETYVLVQKSTGWSISTYRGWLATTWRHLAAAPTWPRPSSLHVGRWAGALSYARCAARSAAHTRDPQPLIWRTCG